MSRSRAVPTSDREGETVALRWERGVAWIELNRPQRRNALRAVDLVALSTALRTAARDPARRAVVVASRDPAMFCSGSDQVAAKADAARAASPAAATAADEVFDAIGAIDVPIVAAVGGPAYGFGCALALACDVRISTQHARFAIPAARLGVAYPVERVSDVVRVCGSSVARSMLLFGRVLDGRRAFALGIVDMLVDGASLHDATASTIDEMVTADRRMSAYLKAALRVTDESGESEPDAGDIRSMRAEIMAARKESKPDPRLRETS